VIGDKILLKLAFFPEKYFIDDRGIFPKYGAKFA
jgi:hypothetical protein